MIPAGSTRVWRKSQRQAWRGTPTGRRVTRKVVTAYGRHQKQAAWLASWAGVRYDQPGGLT